MNKSELIDRIADKAETSKAAASRVLDAIFDASSGAIAEAVKSGKEVKIPGFGKFGSRQRAARKGRNPRTGAEIDIPASTVVTFNAGKGLKDTLGGKAGAASRGRGGSTGSRAGSGGSAAKGAGKKAAPAKGGASKGAAAKGGGAKSGAAKSGAGQSGAAKGGAGKSGGASKSAASKGGGSKSASAAGGAKKR